MTRRDDGPKELAPLLEFVLEEMRSGRYDFESVPESSRLRDLFPSDDKDGDDEGGGFAYTNDGGVITLFLRMKQL
ncbi:hypothetical protein Dcar01_02371 [Deinococcus carri]|uniref:Uncharacterized protein n=1 Tax=Deinococcus carri TaxID=1211323 RepID=A0ABP9W8F0_9DEIO